MKEKKTVGRNTSWFWSVIITTLIAMSIMSAEGNDNKEQLIFTTVVYPTQRSETDALLLVESIRAFAGSLSQAPIWCFVPQYGKELSASIEQRLAELDVTIIRFDIDSETRNFFFAADIQAAACAESMAIDQTHLLVWLGSNTIILQEPKDLLLSDDKALGYRSVHHTNVGSPYDMPLDTFWSLVYKYCGVPRDRVFPMETHVDARTIRPYFNAGILVTRPETHLLRSWRDTFFSVYQKPQLQELYLKDERYTIFIHQAILSGVILHAFSQHEIQELPDNYNYPIHLYEEDVTEQRPSRIEDLITVRHEGFYTDPEWMTKIPAGERLKHWLHERLPKN
jgi:hypothetical protein